MKCAKSRPRRRGRASRERHPRRRCSRGEPRAGLSAESANGSRGGHQLPKVIKSAPAMTRGQRQTGSGRGADNHDRYDRRFTCRCSRSFWIGESPRSLILSRLSASWDVGLAFPRSVRVLACSLRKRRPSAGADDPAICRLPANKGKLRYGNMRLRFRNVTTSSRINGAPFFSHAAKCGVDL